MTPFLQTKPYPHTLILPKVLYTKETVLMVQNALDTNSTMHEDEEKFYIDVSLLSQQECLDMLNFCLYQTKKQKTERN